MARSRNRPGEVREKWGRAVEGGESGGGSRASTMKDAHRLKITVLKDRNKTFLVNKGFLAHLFVEVNHIAFILEDIVILESEFPFAVSNDQQRFYSDLSKQSF